jgi:hypothetical protein
MTGVTVDARNAASQRSQSFGDHIMATNTYDACGNPLPATSASACNGRPQVLATATADLLYSAAWDAVLMPQYPPCSRGRQTTQCQFLERDIHLAPASVQDLSRYAYAGGAAVAVDPSTW